MRVPIHEGQTPPGPNRDLVTFFKGIDFVILTDKTRSEMQLVSQPYERLCNLSAELLLLVEITQPCMRLSQ